MQTTTGKCILWSAYADEKNGLQYDQRTILKFSKLYDVALVVYPAYKDTEASVRRLEERKAEFRREQELPVEAPDTELPAPNSGSQPEAEAQEEQPAPAPTPTDTGSTSRTRTVQFLKIKSST